LRRLTRAARQVAGGDLRVEVPGSSIQEVDALAQAFNQMAHNLLHADQLRRNMTADIAHELRTPLTIIKGKLEGILDGIYPGTAQHIAPVLEEANLLERLIDDLRLLSLAEAGQLPLHREEVDVRELLESVRLSFAREAARNNVDLNVDVAPDTPAVDVDAQRMQQVLGNLVTNSLRYTPTGGRVELRAASEDHTVHILIRDTGAGIAPDELPHIFDRFWRSDKARSHTAAGVGLGLAIARQLVEAHGGNISATSEPGHGTTMIVDLPSVS
jgi:two-component system OmpR family sensor kinase/two-component system sensor histidine kinase BaeS